ncbi:hypothetical protein JCM21900_005785 [Sporobolomyces salmonicolor]
MSELALAAPPGVEGLAGAYNADESAERVVESPVETAHPFADTSNRPSAIRFSRSELGLGRPQASEADDSRDITIKPHRQAPPPPITESDPLPLSTLETVSPSASPSTSANPRHKISWPPRTSSLSRSSTETNISRTGSHRPTKSASSITYAPIPSPSYPVRTQPIGLTHSNSFADACVSPTISGGLTRRLSVSSMSSEGDESDTGGERGPMNRPLMHRSESLPMFSHEKDEEVYKEEKDRAVTAEELAALPPNPKLWLPSHLSIYLSHALSLHPALSTDITAFIRTSRLSGRTFLRLRDADLEELGVNVRWRAVLNETREKLRMEALGGRVLWGFEGARVPVPGEEGSQEPTSTMLGQSGRSLLGPSVRRRNSTGRLEVEGSASEDESSKEEWKRSWRRLNKTGRARVRGLAKAFEAVEEVSERSVTPSPCTSPAFVRTATRVWISGEKNEKPGSGGRVAVKSPYPSRFPRHRRTDSAESAMSTASIDSSGGRYAARVTTSALQAKDTRGRLTSTFSVSSEDDNDPFAGHSSRHSLTFSDYGRPFPFSTPGSTPLRSLAKLELDLTPPLEPPTRPSSSSTPAGKLISNASKPSIAGASSSDQSNILSHSFTSTRPYGLVRRTSGTSAHITAAASHSRPSILISEHHPHHLQNQHHRRASVAFVEGGEGFDWALAPESSPGGSLAARTDDESDSAGEEERTIKPTRTGWSTAFGSVSSTGASWGGSRSEREERRAGLAELFGLNLTRTKRVEKEMTGEGMDEDEDEMLTMLVPWGGDEDGRGGRKGSLVVVKKSQFAALQRRMAEVEAQVTLVLREKGLEDQSDELEKQETNDGGKPGEFVDELESRMTGLERRSRVLASLTSSPAASSPARANSTSAQASSSSPISSLSTALFASSRAYSSLDTSLDSTYDRDHKRSGSSQSRHRAPGQTYSTRYASGEASDAATEGSEIDEKEGERHWWPSEGSMGWKQLSGYVVAASIGIGIVAGEVVAAKLLGVHRR